MCNVHLQLRLQENERKTETKWFGNWVKYRFQLGSKVVCSEEIKGETENERAKEFEMFMNVYVYVCMCVSLIPF